MKEIFAIVVAVAVVSLLVLGAFVLAGANVPAPSPALEAWTKWVAAVLGIAVSARVLWSGAAFLARYS